MQVTVKGENPKKIYTLFVRWDFFDPTSTRVVQITEVVSTLTSGKLKKRMIKMCDLIPHISY